MKFIVEDAGTYLYIKVTEVRIDAAIATPFKDKLREIVVKHRKPLHLDMAMVNFMDSSGLGAMIAVRRSLPDNLAIVLCAMTPNVERVFRLTRMDRVFVISPDTIQKETHE
jgi:anti-sigma B factor antagonist